MTLDTESEAPVKVFEVVHPPDGTTKFVDQVVTYAPPHIEFRYVTWRRFLRIDYDVAHLHWPEMLLRHKNPLVEMARVAVFRSWLRRMRRKGVKIVRTLHNLAPHEAARPSVQRALSELDGLTDLFVTLNPVTQAPGASVFIPHGHYRDRFSSHQRSTSVPGRVVYAGLIRPYKGVEDLIEALGQSGSAALSLRIVGRPSRDLRETVERACAEYANVSARLEFVPDADLVAEITAAELVCLPYKELHNSGMVLVALSLDRPVLVPDTASMRALSEEVGPGWVHTFDSRLSVDDIQAAIESSRAAGRSTRPKLADRDWNQVALRYAAAFSATGAVPGG